MLISEVIRWLEKVREEEGEVNVCVYNKCHEMPCESFLFQMERNQLYIPYCEDTVLAGDFLMME